MVTTATLESAVESEWARKHPVGESSVNDDLLILWNYPVGKSDLSTVHKNALQRFLDIEWKLGPEKSTVELTVHGHASDTGDPKLNQVLAQNRAENVARFMRSQGAPARKIFVSSAGSNEPVDDASSGLAFAKNRRVDVTKHSPALPEPPLPPTNLGGTPEPTEPQPTAATPRPLMSSLAMEIPVSVPLPPVRTPEVIITSKLEGIVKLKIDDKGGGAGGSFVMKDGKISPKLEGEILKQVIGKVSFDPGSGTTPGTLKVGAEKKDWLLSPEMGVQTSPQFLYLNFTLGEIPLPDVLMGDVRVSSKLTGKIKCEIGPGPAMLARAARAGMVASEALAAVAPAAGPLAAFGGSVGVAVLIIGGTIIAIDLAKDEGVRYARLLGRRDGVASRIALELAGDDVRVAFADRRLQWTKMQINMSGDFNAGVAGVEAMIQKPDARKTKSAAWKERFNKEGTQDFTLIRERVFFAVGGYNREGNLGGILEKL